MFELLLQNYETYVYPVAYFGSLAVVGFWEVFYPRRKLSASVLVRWVSAGCLTVINTLLFRFGLPLLGIPFAIWLAQRGIGLFNTIDTPLWLAVLLSFWLLDLSRWFQHWLLHRVPILWLLHRTHHIDHDYDFTTGLRFHPGETLFTASAQILVIALLGAPVEAVILSEIVLVIFAFLGHGNLMIPLGVDRVLRLFIVTPDVHRVHHSAIAAETNANFGGIVTWWDRLFGTYRDQPEGGHEGMVIGLNEFRDPKHLKLHWILANPFLSAEDVAADGPDRLAPSARPAGANAVSSK
ncbi:MAG: sterol desaturase family protein [Alphaproteobacteria bacterium]|nr:sterol desaturase family protein [Alphaproteobacteria bacterium]